MRIALRYLFGRVLWTFGWCPNCGYATDEHCEVCKWPPRMKRMRWLAFLKVLKRERDTQ